ncbi:MAG: hypothetical protein WCT37_03945 [Patescibacteria group bacterium]|jgi:hypothetical protein
MAKFLLIIGVVAVALMLAAAKICVYPVAFGITTGALYLAVAAAIIGKQWRTNNRENRCLIAILLLAISMDIFFTFVGVSALDIAANQEAYPQISGTTSLIK